MGSVYIYNFVMDFVFNVEVEKSSTIYWRFKSLLLLEATMVIILFLVANERLLKILS